MKDLSRNGLIWTGWSRRQFKRLACLIEKELDACESCADYNRANGEDPGEYATEAAEVAELLTVLYNESDENA